jgi:3-hydroxybutyryl-CoA dehydrogenase
MLPLRIRKESTGFIFNRVWRAIKKETLKVVEAGVATHEDVDRAWMIMYGTPYGPFGQMDAIGLDVVQDIEQHYARESADPADLPPPILSRSQISRRRGINGGDDPIMTFDGAREEARQPIQSKHVARHPAGATPGHP